MWYFVTLFECSNPSSWAITERIHWLLDASWIISMEYHGNRRTYRKWRKRHQCNEWRISWCKLVAFTSMIKFFIILTLFALGVGIMYPIRSNYLLNTVINFAFLLSISFNLCSFQSNWLRLSYHSSSSQGWGHFIYFLFSPSIFWRKWMNNESIMRPNTLSNILRQWERFSYNSNKCSR